MHRVLQLAVYPARIILANPLPKGFLPKPGSGKAKDYLHPDEETLLLGCCQIPLVRRVFWGTLVREGMRREEAVGLDWCHLDLDHGQVRLDSNKTDDPRAWALSPDVVIALKQWRIVRGQVETTDPVFVGTNGERLNVQHAADQLRADLQTAGVTRAELFESSAHRQALRAHDLRATFITIAIATGKSEAWISDRTGHKSSLMIHRYYRQARTFTDLGLGALSPMNEAIPEFVAQKWPRVGPSNSNADPSAINS
jgi:integrase